MNVISLDRIYTTFSRYKWPFDFDSRVEEHFSKLKKGNPSLWEGEVLLSCSHLFIGNALNATFFLSKYSTFTAIRDGVLDISKEPPVIRNLSPAVALITSDNHVLIGRMSSKTGTPGVFVLPGGIPEYTDIDDDGVIDLEKVAFREFKEEVGSIDMISCLPGWLLIIDGWRMIVVKQYYYPFIHKEIKIRRGNDEELSELKFVGSHDKFPNMPSWSRGAIDRIFDMLETRK